MSGLSLCNSEPRNGREGRALPSLYLGVEQLHPSPVGVMCKQHGIGSLLRVCLVGRMAGQACMETSVMAISGRGQETENIGNAQRVS